MALANSSVALPIPQPARAVSGAVFLTAILLFFVALAVFNLMNGVAIIASVIWLLLVTAMLCGFCKEFGIRRVAVEILGAFARRHFIWCTRASDGTSQIEIGYEIFDARFVLLSVPAKHIESVNWSTGQASHFAGKDVNDWSVALWYDHGDMEKSRRQQNWRKPDQEIHILGKSGPKADTAAFGQRLINFLCDAEVLLQPGDNDCTFVRQSGSTRAVSQSS